mmetsp:Transcript_29802/g.84999  ORF Transcript_29802/g.84999 Transcript_29802/m.84999 type:complete len:200 (-) Transcript_29802:495-1094(-)
MSSLTKLHMSWARILTSSPTRMRPLMAPSTLAYLLISRMRSLTTMACSVLMRSSLFKMILSAKAICWYASFTLPSSTWSSSLPIRCLASAIATTASKRKSAVNSGLDMKVLTMGTGSAMPVVSMRIWSMVSPFLMSSMICCRPCARSPRIVQHMQPLSMTMTFSAVFNFSCLSRASSMEISPNSFSMMANFFSLCSCKM